LTTSALLIAKAFAYGTLGQWDFAVETVVIATRMLRSTYKHRYNPRGVHLDVNASIADDNIRARLGKIRGGQGQSELQDLAGQACEAYVCRWLRCQPAGQEVNMPEWKKERFRKVSVVVANCYP
jgi:hypothetical protein